MEKYISKTNIKVPILFLISFFLLATQPLLANRLKTGTKKDTNSRDYSKAENKLVNHVQYTLNYLGLKLCPPIDNQDETTLVYKLGYENLSDKILLPIQEVLTQNDLQAGKLTKFPQNQGFSYRVLYNYKHIGNIIVLNKKYIQSDHSLIPTKKGQITVEKNHNSTEKSTIVQEAPETIPQDDKIKEEASIVPLPGTTPKMAIIIDDFGYTRNDRIHKFLDIDLDLTISILPGHRFSTWTSNRAEEIGKEVIIHMPMESDKYHLNNGEKDFLISSELSDQEVFERIQSAYQLIPAAKGMNNHMGSIATGDPKVVLAVIKALKKLNLYYIDSLTSPLSIMYENCIIYDVPAAKRRYFIDNKKDKQHIIRQLRKAISYANRRGRVIVIGHSYSETLQALRYMKENNEFQNIEICPPSELVHQ